MQRFIALLVFFLIVSSQSPAQKAVIYAALYDENNLALIDPEAGRIIQRVQVGRNPDNVILTKDKSTLYMSNTGELTVSLVSLADKRVRQVLRLPANRRNIFSGPMTMSPDGSRIFVAERTDTGEPLRIYVIDTQKENIVDQFEAGRNISAVSVSFDGRKIFVVNKGEGVAVFDSETYKPIGRVEPIKSAAQDVAFIACSPGSARACISYGPQNKIQIISTDTYATEKIVPIPKFQTGNQRDIAFDRSGRFAFIINDKVDIKEVDGVNVLDMSKGEIIKLFNSGVVQRGMITSEDNNTYYVAGSDLKTYNALTLEHLRSVALRTRIFGIVVVTAE